MLHSQSAHDFEFTIDSKVDLGTLWIGEAFYLPQYKAGLFEGDSAVHKDGVYKFKNKIMYPTAIRVFNAENFNQLVFLEPGINEAEIIVKDSVLDIYTRSKVEQEHKLFLQQMGIGNLNQPIPMKKFQAFVQTNPRSYIALFALIDQMFNYRFSPEMRPIAASFDTAIKASKAFSYFNEQYLIKKRFIPIDVVNDKGKTVTVNFDPTKYTLIDFWWIGCKGCYEDMRKLNQKIQFLNNNVRIMSINTDNRKEFKNSIKRFSQQKLSWKSYWDFDEKRSGKNIFFYKYPTNLLIDKKGYIVATDIDVSRLEDFVNE